MTTSTKTPTTEAEEEERVAQALFDLIVTALLEASTEDEELEEPTSREQIEARIVGLLAKERATRDEIGTALSDYDSRQVSVALGRLQGGGIIHRDGMWDDADAQFALGRHVAGE